MDKDTGGPAFPVPDIDGGKVCEGMTLRDYFAAKAMLMYLQDPDVQEIARHPDAIAEWCYVMADSMLKARKQA
jgi:hypothetical protein